MNTVSMVWAFNHTGKSATVIEGATGKVVATVPLSGAVVVTTPQDVAFADVLRAVRITDAFSGG